MRIPRIQGIIDRRVLVNFRVDAEVLARVCPPPFRPKTVCGFGIAGICLIRLKEIRPSLLPAFLGISSENAAHRIAVEWNENGGTRTGVYIPRRDTSSMLNALAGGRIFPGVHNHASFHCSETENEYRIEMKSDDNSAGVVVEGRKTTELNRGSIFGTMDECSKFFEAGTFGYSPARTKARYEGLELRAIDWEVQALEITEIHSSFFHDRKAFPEGSVTFDNALFMENVQHEWHSCQTICCSKA